MKIDFKLKLNISNSFLGLHSSWTLYSHTLIFNHSQLEHKCLMLRENDQERKQYRSNVKGLTFVSSGQKCKHSSEGGMNVEEHPLGRDLWTAVSVIQHRAWMENVNTAITPKRRQLPPSSFKRGPVWFETRQMIVFSAVLTDYIHTTLKCPGSCSPRLLLCFTFFLT